MYLCWLVEIRSFSIEDAHILYLDASKHRSTECPHPHTRNKQNEFMGRKINIVKLQIRSQQSHKDL